MKRLILSMRVSEASGYFEMRNSIAFDYVEFFEKLGFIIIPIPNNTKHVDEYVRGLNVDGIVLTGGNNVNPCLYNGKEELESVYDERDEIEKQLVNLSVKNKIPLLGICRGFQYINVYFGGSIYHNLKGHVKEEHFLISKNKLMNNVLTNSYHNQAVLKKNISKEFEITASTEDGVVEAISHKHHKIIGLQWHPERQDTKEDRELINIFFKN